MTPDGFSGLRVMDVGDRAADAPQIWLSLREARLWPATARPQTPWLSLGGRLSADATLRSARAELDVVARRIAIESPPGTPVDRQRSSFRIYRAGLSWRDEPSQSLLTLGLFLFIPLSVLAIGCVNVINLQLARGMDEAVEMSLRLALGASRARILWLQLPDVVCSRDDLRRPGHRRRARAAGGDGRVPGVAAGDRRHRPGVHGVSRDRRGVRGRRAAGLANVARRRRGRSARVSRPVAAAGAPARRAGGRAGRARR